MPTAGPSPEPTPALGSASPPRRGVFRRGGRTALLIACAAAFGVIAGSVTGYVIQSGRPETPLPKLGQAGLFRPDHTAKGPYATASDDDLTRTDGDLRQLLLPVPAGAKDVTVEDDGAVDNWSTVSDWASTYQDPSDEFAQLLGEDFRRLADRAWRDDADDWVSIRLIQFNADGSSDPAQAFYDAEQSAVAGSDGTLGEEIPGTLDGHVFVQPKPTERAGYLPEYEVRALARHGDIVMYVIYDADHPISESTVMDLAKRQLERL
ncbi:hypothetical protein [Streptomyces sp. ICBB 8177]|uniref:hypothetical protein n=1 Tax=Streptomyces sp. ICBB 8177 TaxID=563922 RepID=UPI000D67E607|nr:hypothetical protein [Streptomyces sp. ICBB 8177]PWI45792.1 hypothetical protein CK485_01065 [Streptomyces sp. ICBB 8177]